MFHEQINVKLLFLKVSAFISFQALHDTTDAHKGSTILIFSHFLHPNPLFSAEISDVRM